MIIILQCNPVIHLPVLAKPSIIGHFSYIDKDITLADDNPVGVAHQRMQKSRRVTIATGSGNRDLDRPRLTSRGWCCSCSARSHE